jgi:hypothetical protein
MLVSKFIFLHYWKVSLKDISNALIEKSGRSLKNWKLTELSLNVEKNDSQNWETSLRLFHFILILPRMIYEPPRLLSLENQSSLLSSHREDRTFIRKCLTDTNSILPAAIDDPGRPCFSSNKVPQITMLSQGDNSTNHQPRGVSHQPRYFKLPLLCLDDEQFMSSE